RKAGDFVHLLFDRDAGLQVLELNRACRFGEDREGVRIPFAHGLAKRDRLAVFHAKPRTIDDVVAFLFAAFLVDDGDQAGTVHRDEDLAAAFDDLQVDELHEAVVAGLDLRLFGDAGGGTANVERPHRELRAGLANGLRGDDAHCLAHLDEAARGQVAAIAAAADSAAGFASEHRANLHSLDAGSLDCVRQLFRDLLVDLDNHGAFVVLDLLERNAANDAVAQRLDFDAGFENRLNVDSVGRAAVELVDDHVLSHVHQAAREVAGIGGLERRIGQALAGSVGRDEVLQHGQALAEVRCDRRFDNFAGGLGHQAAHSGKLPDLLLRTAGAGIGHDVDRVIHALLILLFERLEHLVGDFFGDVRPDGDDLVVALAVGDGAIEILLLDLDDLMLGGIDELELHAGDDHVADADGHAGLGRVEEAKLFQLVESHHGLLESEAEVAVLHERLHALLLEQAVDEGHFRRQVIVEDHAANGGVQKLFAQVNRLGMRDVLIVVSVGEIDHLAGVAHANRRQQLDLA